MNQTNLMGYLGRDAVMRATKTGKAVAELSVATSRFKGKDEQGKPKTETTWHKVTCWGKLAERCRGLKKGQQVFVCGEYLQNMWTNKEGKQEREMYLNANVVMGVQYADVAGGTASYGDNYVESGYAEPQQGEQY